MAAELSSINTVKAHVEVPWYGLTINIVYTPGSITQAKFDEADAEDTITDFLEDIIDEWDITSNGEPVEPTAKNMNELLPAQFPRHVFRHVMLASNDEAGKPEGSFSGG